MPSTKKYSTSKNKAIQSTFAVQYAKDKHINKQDKMNVVQRSTSTLFVIPSEDVFLCQSKRSLVLCEEFDACYPDTSCRYGSKCRWVHASTERALRKYIHINWLWRNRDDCAATYPLMAEGRLVTIKPPTGENGEETVVDSGRVLQTRCLFNDPKRPASHCAHFCYGRECHLGALCDFAHVIHIDGNAAPGERAHTATPFAVASTAVTPATRSLTPLEPNMPVLCLPPCNNNFRGLTRSDSKNSFTCNNDSLRTPPTNFLCVDECLAEKSAIVKCGGGRWRYDPYGAVVMSRTPTPESQWHPSLQSIMC